MKFSHDHFEIDIDTDSENVCDKIKILERLYKKIPCTICLFCPKKDTVEADCCKHFSPPMYLIEFIHALQEIGKLSECEQKLLHFSCHESYLNPSIVRPCVLLNGTLCSIYKARPFSCRMYPSYPKKEWEKRLKKVSMDWGISIDKIPMKDQCQNVRVDGNLKKISLKEENEIFRDIADIDIGIFKDEELGREVVYSAMTYLPFDAHYLLMKEGPDKLEELSDIRSLLISENEKFSSGKSDRSRLTTIESEVKDLLVDIKNKIFSNEEDSNENSQS